MGILALLCGVVLGGAPAPLEDAKKLAEQLRFEEAVVEYQRYLGLPDRPLAERASALIDLGFIHLVLGDATSAEARALEAFELDGKVAAPAGASTREVEFVEKMRKAFAARARVEVVPRADNEPPYLVKVRVVDPEGRVSRLLLRHALTATGPFYSTEMRCSERVCEGLIPPPRGVKSYTAWYFAEALDAKSQTLARVAGPASPLQLAVLDQRSWLENPVVWGVAGGVVVVAAAVVFLLAPAPPR